MGAGAGLLGGAAVGMAVGGPPGAVVGGAIGAVGGAIAGEAAEGDDEAGSAQIALGGAAAGALVGGAVAGPPGAVVGGAVGAAVVPGPVTRPRKSRGDRPSSPGRTPLLTTRIPAIGRWRHWPRDPAPRRASRPLLSPRYPRDDPSPAYRPAAPPFERVPPRAYGGTERIVHGLVTELDRRGHEVTTFASGDSMVAGRHIQTVPEALRPLGYAGDSLPYMQLTLHEILRPRGQFDLIHSHLEWANLLLARVSPDPGRLDVPRAARPPVGRRAAAPDHRPASWRSTASRPAR